MNDGLLLVVCFVAVALVSVWIGYLAGSRDKDSGL